MYEGTCGAPLFRGNRLIAICNREFCHIPDKHKDTSSWGSYLWEMSETHWPPFED